MKKTLKALVLVLALSLIFTAFVFSFGSQAADVTGITVKKDANFESVAVGLIGKASDKNGDSYVNPSAGGVQFIQGGRAGIVTAEQSPYEENKYILITQGDSVGTSVPYLTVGLGDSASVSGGALTKSANDVSNFSFYSFDLDVMTPTGEFINGANIDIGGRYIPAGSTSRDFWNGGHNNIVTFDTDGTGKSYLYAKGDTTKKIYVDAGEWVHITVIVEVASFTMDNIDIRTHVYVNGEYHSSVEGVTPYNYYNNELHAAFTEFRLNYKTNSDENQTMAVDNIYFRNFSTAYNGNLGEILAKKTTLEGWESNAYAEDKVPFGPLVAKNATTGEVYESLSEAVDAASELDVIELYANAKETVYVNDLELDIDLKGYTAEIELGNGCTATYENGVCKIRRKADRFEYTAGGEKKIATYGTTLAQVISAADAGSTVKLLADAKVTSAISISKDITIDLNGCAIDSTTVGTKFNTFNVGMVTFTVTSSVPGGKIFNAGVADGQVKGNAIFNFNKNNGTLKLIGRDADGNTTLSTYSATLVQMMTFAGRLEIDGGEYYRNISDGSALINANKLHSIDIKNATLADVVGFSKPLIAVTGRYPDLADAPLTVDIDSSVLVGEEIVGYTYSAVKFTISNSFINGNITADTFSTSRDEGTVYLGEGNFLNPLVSLPGNVVAEEGLTVSSLFSKLDVTLNFNEYSAGMSGASFKINSYAKTLYSSLTTATSSESLGAYEFIKGGESVVASDKFTLAEVIDMADEGCEIKLVNDISVQLPGGGLSISKGLVIDLNGKTLTVLQGADDASIFINTPYEVRFKNGKIAASLEGENKSAPLFVIRKFGASLVLDSLNTYTGSLVKSVATKGAEVTVIGGEHHLAIPAVSGGAIVRSEASVIFNARDAKFYIAEGALIHSMHLSGGEKSVFTFDACDIIGVSADYNVIPYANSLTEIVFKNSLIAASIAPSLGEGDSAGAPTSATVILGEGTRVASGAAVSSASFGANLEYSDINENKTVALNLQSGSVIGKDFSTVKTDKSYTFVKLVSKIEGVYTVTWYSEDGKTVIRVDSVAAGSAASAPEYTAGSSNGWYTANYSGWATSFGGKAVTDFTVNADVSYYPAVVEGASISPSLTAAMYNLTLYGAVRVNFYLPVAPDGVEVIGVYDEAGNVVARTTQNIGGVRYYGYNLGLVGAMNLTDSVKVTVKYTVNGTALEAEKTLSPISYAETVLADSKSDSPAFSSAAYALVADMVRYSNELYNAVNKTDSGNPALEALIASYGELASDLPNNNDFGRYTTNASDLKGYIQSVSFEVSSFQPRYVFNVVEGSGVVDIKILMSAYKTDLADGVNFGEVVYEIDSASTKYYSGEYIKTAYTANIPMYNVDCPIKIVVTLADGSEISGTYNLDFYFRALSADADEVARVRSFLKAMRAYSDSSAAYRFPEGAVSEIYTVSYDECDHQCLINFAGEKYHYCRDCDTYIFEYKYYGAVGDGTVNDFAYINAAHTDANAFLAANPGENVKVYAGKGTSGNAYFRLGVPEILGADGLIYAHDASIPINTDTDWSNTRFDFDDREISEYDSLRYVSLFKLSSSYTTSYTGKLSKGLRVGDTNIGFAPGRPMLIMIQNNNIKHYIRHGANANDGDAQQEVLLVDEFGNIDPSTPLQWDYEVITSATGYNTDDAPVTISGLDRDGNISCYIDNIANHDVDTYSYISYSRNIKVSRGNVTVMGIDHELIESDASDARRQPYSGIVQPEYAANLVMKDFRVKNHISRYIYENVGDDDNRSNDTKTSTLLGSYEFSARCSANVSWINCQVTNFFGSSGEVTGRGLFGTNYVRNMYVKDTFLTSFDAHTGAYNVTIEDSIFEHINYIGGGDIILNNTTIYADYRQAALVFRSDYGATWDGDAYIDGLKIKYSKTGFKYIDLFQATYTDHYFGYTTHLPKNIYLKNVETEQFSYTFKNGVRTETYVATNKIPLAFYYQLNSEMSKCVDYTTVNDWNNNPRAFTENIYISECENLNFTYPDHFAFKNMNVYIDGVAQDWFSERSSYTHTNEDGDKLCDICGAEIKSSGGSCFVSGTLITLADGSVKPIEELTIEDEVLVFNHETGAFEPAFIVFIENDGVSEYSVINLAFSDGTRTGFIYEHALFDLTLGKYVYITEENCADFVGHEFAILSGDSHEAVTLTEAYVSKEITGCYSLVSAYHLNYYVDGLLSIPGGIEGIFNIFEYGEDLVYDAEKMQADIEKYGLYTYDDFADYVPYEIFEYAFPAKYFKVAIGKGMLTFDDILGYIEKYLVKNEVI